MCLENPGKGYQRFVDADVLLPGPDWSNRILNSKNRADEQFKSCHGASDDAENYQTV